MNAAPSTFDAIHSAPNTDTGFKLHARRSEALLATLRTLATSLETAVEELRDRGLKLVPIDPPGPPCSAESIGRGIEESRRSFDVDVGEPVKVPHVIGDGVPFVNPPYKVTAPGLHALKFHAINDGEFRIECTSAKRTIASITFARAAVELQPKFTIGGAGRSSEPHDAKSFDAVLRAWLNESSLHFAFDDA